VLLPLLLMRVCCALLPAVAGRGVLLLLLLAQLLVLYCARAVGSRQWLQPPCTVFQSMPVLALVLLL
jgi:hypothetical protein